jgi:hypothetical protein
MSGKNKRSISPSDRGGFFQELSVRFKLVFRLMADRRVSPVIKLLPIGSLVYFVIPDIVPGPIDDAVVIWLGTFAFVELCPPDVVQEHMEALTGVVDSQWRDPVEGRDPIDDDEVVDAEYRVEE